jgi:hypothetical protein
MKKLLMIFFFLIFYMEIQAQYIIKADYYKERIRENDTLDFSEWSIAKGDSTVITITHDSLVIIDNPEKDSYKLDSLLSKGVGTDIDDGDTWIGNKWSCDDNKGIGSMIVS